MVIGSVLGGLLCVALDAVINKKGGYVRNASSTLAHVAARRRDQL